MKAKRQVNFILIVEKKKNNKYLYTQEANQNICVAEVKILSIDRNTDWHEWDKILLLASNKKWKLDINWGNNNGKSDPIGVSYTC